MLTSEFGVYLTALLVGLLGGVHCLSMCGGLVSSLTLGLDAQIRRDPWRMLPYQLAYNLGRLAGYLVGGALVGGLGAMLLQLDSLQILQRLLYVLAGAVMVLLGLYLAGWWRALAVVERQGLRLWRRLEPVARRLLPVRSWRQALVMGFIWAWIPCGLVYSVLLTAVATASPLDGAIVMLMFGLGTLPNLLGIAMLAGAAARIAERAWARQLAGVLVMGFGIYALWQVGFAG
ncbi:sulfite exporter TauE/SafE family protein [Thiorhodococcus mannitoliphagus]|uniref:Sulfite exporter TauE/SafE family protein n=1 Tax=Thiorhodococcus mannitoliphagus TaxID=329406 RepID=A0A6P1DLD1_9GAMM|nr:sulfite exporter TauE/SafE family protein [Thiorhodococcus mannitoliphagus]NEX18828.1 sulfite exporter TauE/SafE family protein [Thiorhodococcus mannitoliphagus]